MKIRRFRCYKKDNSISEKVLIDLFPGEETREVTHPVNLECMYYMTFDWELFPYEVKSVKEIPVGVFLYGDECREVIRNKAQSRMEIMEKIAASNKRCHFMDRDKHTYKELIKVYKKFLEIIDSGEFDKYVVALQKGSTEK